MLLSHTIDAPWTGLGDTQWGKTDAGYLQRLWDNLQIHVPPLTG